jgi:hypothetical protein
MPVLIPIMEMIADSAIRYHQGAPQNTPSTNFT